MYFLSHCGGGRPFTVPTVKLLFLFLSFLVYIMFFSPNCEGLENKKAEGECK